MTETTQWGVRWVGGVLAYDNEHDARKAARLYSAPVVSRTVRFTVLSDWTDPATDARVTHYPHCNPSCVGDDHLLAGDPA